MKERKPLLRQANLSLEVLRFQMRLAHELRCLRTSSYGHASASLHEIGSMVGGWMKARSLG